MIDFDKNRRFRRLILAWIMLLITVFVTWAFIDPPDIPQHTAQVILGVIGLLAVGFGFYQWHKRKDEEKN